MSSKFRSAVSFWCSTAKYWETFTFIMASFKCETSVFHHHLFRTPCQPRLPATLLQSVRRGNRYFFHTYDNYKIWNLETMTQLWKCKGIVLCSHFLFTLLAWNNDWHGIKREKGYNCILHDINSTEICLIRIGHHTDIMGLGHFLCVCVAGPGVVVTLHLSWPLNCSKYVHMLI